MDEILQKLISSEFLSEETKAEISEQWSTATETFKTQVREEVSAEVRLELSEQFLAERDQLVEKVDQFVAEALKKELAEFHGDVAEYRDQQVVMAEAIVEEKHRLAEEVAKELDELVEKLDAFLEMRLSAEFDELKEELDVVKQNTFGRKLYEAFAQTYAQVHQDDDSTAAKLAIAEQKLASAEERLAEAEETAQRQVRESKLEKLLGGLNGKKREQMELVLKGVETSRLEESYKYFIGKILKEDAEPQAKPLNEDVSNTTVVTGNTPVDSAETRVDEGRERLRRLAGLM